jgi:hypothetical protein
VIEREPKGSTFGRTQFKPIPEEPPHKSKLDQRFSQKGRTAQHWFIPVLIQLAAAVP